MELLGIRNPFPDGRSYLASLVDSTQDEARRLAEAWEAGRGGSAFPPGSLVAAEEQGAGRGRVVGRRWSSEPGRDLLFTLRLSPEAALLPALPLRVGAAICRGAAGYASSISAAFPAPPRVKWPNDLMIGDRKAAGILCEAGRLGVLAGIGVNCADRAFPPELRGRATSLEAELGRPVDRRALLELILAEIRSALGEADWRSSISGLLWKRGEEVLFSPGPAAELGFKAEPIRARLAGVDGAGALELEFPDGRTESFLSGELTAALPTR